jgi:hypothetical protein
MKSSESFKQTIKAYLDSRAEQDKLFAESYAKPNKNIDECINFILSEVKKSGCNGFTDEEVYSFAVHYYDEDSIKDVKPVNAQVVVNHKIELSEEEKKKAHDQAFQELLEQQKAEIMHTNRKPAKKVKAEIAIEQSLFD